MDPPPVRALPEAVARAVSAAATRHRFGRGEVVFHEGDLADTVHLVAEGRVAVRRDTRTGETVILTVLGPGALLGEMAMLVPGTRRTTTVVALEPVATTTITFTELDRLRREHAAFDRLMLELLAERVRRLSDHLLEALHAPVEQRVLRRLAAVCRTYDGGAEGPTSVPLTQAEIGELAGASRPATNRVLRRLAEDGVVRLGRGAVLVLDPAALARQAGA